MPTPLTAAHPPLTQVELNTIASSFGCLSTLVARGHRYLLGRLGASAAELAALPEHNAMDAIVDAMGAAAADYGAPGGVMVMVVQPGERNAYDQQWLQTRLWERHGVRTLRRSLAQVGWQQRCVWDASTLPLRRSARVPAHTFPPPDLPRSLHNSVNRLRPRGSWARTGA